MPARNTPFLDDHHRKRIQISMILNRLRDHIEGKIQLSSTQVAAANILLKKVMPDLASLEHKGEVTTKHVVSPEPTTTEWRNDFTEQPTRPH